MCAGQLRVGFHPFSHRLVRGDPAEHPLASGIVGLVEALEQGLEVPMAVDGDPQHLTLHTPVETLHEAIGLRCIRLGPAVLHLQLAAGLLKAIRREAGSSVRQDVRDLEGERGDRLFQETALVVSSSSLTARCTQREQRSIAT